MRLFSYVLRFDDGAAPNPFWGYCTLTICKPRIRKIAKVGDWVVGWGSKNVWQNGERHNFQNHFVYVMKVANVLTLKEYDKWCAENAPKKIPKMKSKDFKRRAGDCIYEYAPGKIKPAMRDSVHSSYPPDRDLRGLNALVSDHFYYFGENPISVPKKFLELVKSNQGHKIIHDGTIVQDFISWLEANFLKNKLYGNPQIPVPADEKSRKTCAKKCFDYDDCDDVTEIKYKKQRCM